jgi:hypothetical protein
MLNLLVKVMDFEDKSEFKNQVLAAWTAKDENETLKVINSMNAHLETQSVSVLPPPAEDDSDTGVTASSFIVGVANVEELTATTEKMMVDDPLNCLPKVNVGKMLNDEIDRTNKKVKVIDKTSMMKDAVISSDGVYRYTLLRVWNVTKQVVMFVMYNPSTADAKNDDATIRRIISFARSWGYGGVHVVNLYAFRSVDPKLIKKVINPIGKDNIFYVTSLVGRVEKVIYAWGSLGEEPNWLRNLVDTPYCLGVNKDGSPKKPLYLKKDLQLQIYTR